MPETDAILLEFLMSVLEKQMNADWELTYDMSGDIAVIDIDEQSGLDLFNKTKARDNSPVIIALSSGIQKVDAEFNLQKPMRSANFLAVIKEILEKNPDTGREKEADEASTVTNLQPALDTNKTEENKSTKTVQNNVAIKRPSVKRLYNFLTEDAGSYTKPIEVIYLEVSIYLDFKSNLLFCEHKLMLLSMLSKADISKLQIREMKDADFKKVQAEVPSRPISELIWCCALLGSSGELISSIDENSVLHLKRWPNLKSLVHLPRHITLTAYMTKYKSSLSEISVQTRVPIDHVVDFVNACLLLGYLDKDVKRDEKQQQEIKHDSAKQGLFGKIRNKFGLKASA